MVGPALPPYLLSRAIDDGLTSARTYACSPRPMSGRGEHAYLRDYACAISEPALEIRAGMPESCPEPWIPCGARAAGPEPKN